MKFSITSLQGSTMLWHFDFKKELDGLKFFDREAYKLEIESGNVGLLAGSTFKDNKLESKFVSANDRKIILTATKED